MSTPRKLKAADVLEQPVGCEYTLRLPQPEVISRWERGNRFKSYCRLLRHQVQQALKILLTDEQLNEPQQRPAARDYARRFEIAHLDPSKAIQQLSIADANEYERLSSALGLELNPQAIQDEYLYFDPERPLAPPVIRLNPEVLAPEVGRVREALNTVLFALDLRFQKEAPPVPSNGNGHHPEHHDQIQELLMSERELAKKTRRQKVLLSEKLDAYRKEQAQLSQMGKGVSAAYGDPVRRARYEKLNREIPRLEGELKGLQSRFHDRSAEIQREIKKLQSP